MIIFLISFQSFSQKRINVLVKDSLENNIIQKLVNTNTKIDSVKNKLNYLGYLNHSIKFITETDSTEIFQIELNQQIKGIQIHYNNPELAPLFKKLNLIVTNNQFQISFQEISNLLNSVTHYYESIGNSFVKVRLKNFALKNKSALAELEIHSSKRRTVDKIIVKGYDKFPEKFIKNVLITSKKEIFNKSYLIKLTNRIQNIPFINQIKKPEVHFKKDSTIIYVYLKKKKINQFDGLIGINTDNKQKLKLNGHLFLSLENVFDQGENINLNWKNTITKDKEFHFKVDLPYIFKSKISPKTQFSIFSKDSSFVNIKFNTRVNYTLNYKNSLGIIFEMENSKNILKNKIIAIQDYTNILYGINYNFQTPYKKLDYKTKSLIGLNLLYGDSKTTETIKVSKLNLNATYLFEINSNNILFLKNNTYLYLSDSIYDNQVNWIGGNNTIRGFKENSIPSSKYTITNIEYNYLINNDTSLYTVTDYGYVNNTLNKSYKSIYAIGIGYKTRIKNALININYTLGKINNTPFTPENATLNITLLNYF